MEGRKEKKRASEEGELPKCNNIFFWSCNYWHLLPIPDKKKVWGSYIIIFLWYFSCGPTFVHFVNRSIDRKILFFSNFYLRPKCATEYRIVYILFFSLFSRKGGAELFFVPTLPRTEIKFEKKRDVAVVVEKQQRNATFFSIFLFRSRRRENERSPKFKFLQRELFYSPLISLRSFFYSFPFFLEIRLFSLGDLT